MMRQATRTNDPCSGLGISTSVVFTLDGIRVVTPDGSKPAVDYTNCPKGTGAALLQQTVTLFEQCREQGTLPSLIDRAGKRTSLLSCRDFLRKAAS